MSELELVLNFGGELEKTLRNFFNAEGIGLGGLTRNVERLLPISLYEELLRLVPIRNSAAHPDNFKLESREDFLLLKDSIERKFDFILEPPSLLRDFFRNLEPEEKGGGFERIFNFFELKEDHEVLDKIDEIKNSDYQAIPILILALKNETHRVRREALLKLKDINEKTFTALFSLLYLFTKEERPLLKDEIEMAILEIADKNNKKLPKIILKELKVKGVSDFSFFICKALGIEDLKTKNLIGTLNQVFQRDNDTLQFWAIQTFLEFEDKKDFLAHLIDSLENENPFIRKYSLLSLQEFETQKDKIVPLITKKLLDEEQDVRLTAAQVLSELTSQDFHYYFTLSNLKHSDTAFLETTTWGLRKFENIPQEIIPQLLELLQHDDIQVVCNTCSILANIKEPDSSINVALSKKISNGSKVGERAAQALGERSVFSTNAIEMLSSFFKDKNPKVRQKAVEGLSFSKEAATQIKQEIIYMLDESDKTVLQVVLNLLIKIKGPKEAYPKLLELMESNSDEKLSHYVKCALRAVTNDKEVELKILIHELKTSSPNICVSKILELKKFKECKNVNLAIPTLVELANNNTDELVRIYAVDALKEIGNDSDFVISALEKSLRDQSDSVRSKVTMALGHLGKNNKKTLSLLLNAIWDSSEDVQYYAIESLGQFGKQAKAAISQLESIIEKGEGYYEEDIVSIAKWALEEIRSGN